MFSLQITVEHVGDGIDNRIQQIDSLRQSIPEEMVAWQRDDMNRKYPNIETLGDSWLTLIWPTSRLQVRRRARGRKRATVYTTAAAGRRPILRAELLVMLMNRLRPLLKTMTQKGKT